MLIGLGGRPGDSELMKTALSKVAPPDKAMHPQRAAGGNFLLHSVAGALEVLNESNDSSRAVIEQLFLDSIPANTVEIESIVQVLHPPMLKRFLAKVAEEQASVEVTFHGTRAEYVEQILREGLNPSMCVTGAYGRGAYVATHAGVAHQYADPDPSGRRHMCAMLVVVGNAVVKGREGESARVTAMDSLVNPTQYCLLEEERLYVSHLICYRVKGGEPQRTGGGFQDPFQAKLSSAVRADAQRRFSAGIR